MHITNGGLVLAAIWIATGLSSTSVELGPMMFIIALLSTAIWLWKSR